MTKPNQPKSSSEFADRLLEAMSAVPPETPVEVEAEFKRAGLDPAAVAHRMVSFIDNLVASSPHDWRQKATAERHLEMAKRNRVTELRGWSRENLLARISSLASRGGEAPGLTANFRYYEGLPDDDLVTLVADLEYLLGEEG